MGMYIKYEANDKWIARLSKAETIILSACNTSHRYARLFLSIALRLVSGKIPVAYIHGELALPRFRTITCSARIPSFFRCPDELPAKFRERESGNPGAAGKLNLLCRTTDEMEFNY